MCRSIHQLHNFEPPATDDEVRAAALQFVRKVSGMAAPSRANQEVFDRAVVQIEACTRELLGSLAPSGVPRDREVERLKARARWERRERASAG